jgi:hypothetical protein
MLMIDPARWRSMFGRAYFIPEVHVQALLPGSLTALVQPPLDVDPDAVVQHVDPPKGIDRYASDARPPQGHGRQRHMRE